jgi:hypothetical protein
MILYNLNKNKSGLLHTLVLVLLFVTGTLINFGCSTYSFTGASVPAHLKTIAIPIADDKSPAAIPGIRELLTNDLIQKFINDNSLQVAERSKADATLECVITSVTDAPAIVSAGEQISSRRLTINVKVIYTDLVTKKTIFENNFNNYGDYVPGEATNDRDVAIATAVDKISEDILLAVVSGW